MTKGLIFLQRQFAIMGTAIAASLKKDYGVNEFCGIVFTRKAQRFSQSQTHISYTKVLIDEDMHTEALKEKLDVEYLKELEREYGFPNLWPYVIADRTIMMQIPPKDYVTPPRYNHEEILKIIQGKFKTILNFLDEEKPDFMIMPAIGGLGSLILYHVAKKRGIKIIKFDIPRIKNLVSVTEDYKTLTGADEIFHQSAQSSYRKEAEEYLKEFREKHTTYAPHLASIKTVQQKSSPLPRNPLRSLLWMWRMTTSYTRDPYKHDYTAEKPWEFLKNKVRRSYINFRLNRVKSLYNKPNWNEDFVFYQLHYEPEIAIALLGPFYADQINTIRQIARSLPAHFKLYVREHRDMIGIRPMWYYKKIKEIPNVKLLSPFVELFDILENSKLVTVITSTAGWEAALLGKPVITFGDVYFNTLPNVKRCRELEQLPYLIKAQLEDTTNYDDGLVNFIAAAIQDSVPFDYHKHWQFSSYENIAHDPLFPGFVKLIAQKLNKA